MEVRRPDAVLAGLTDPDGPHYSGLATHADAAAPYPVVMAHLPPLGDLLTGARPGGIGETCAMIIVVCGVYLIYRNYIKWQLPVAMILTAAVVAALAPIHLTANPESLGAWRMFPVAIEGPDVGITYVFCQLLSCELLLAAFFFATEMTSRPITTGGQVIFAMGCGLIGMVLKLYVDMPIPFYAAVLIMNTFSLRLDSIWHPWHSIQRDPEPSAARAD